MIQAHLIVLELGTNHVNVTGTGLVAGAMNALSVLLQGSSHTPT